MAPVISIICNDLWDRVRYTEEIFISITEFYQALSKSLELGKYGEALKEYKSAQHKPSNSLSNLVTNSLKSQTFKKELGKKQNKNWQW